MKWIFIVVALSVLIIVGNITYKQSTYPSIEVVNYETMLKKAAYGSINNHELRIGAFQMVREVQCQKSTDDLTHNCIEAFEIVKEMCARKTLDTEDAKRLDDNQAHQAVLQFNGCFDKA
jgi:hypothetical protein